MEDPIPTFTHLVRALREFPQLAYLHMIEPCIEASTDLVVDEHNEWHSNDFIRELWGNRTLISAGGYNRTTALDRAEQGEIVAFGRPFLANVRILEFGPKSIADDGEYSLTSRCAWKRTSR
jgi:NADPH2 dehydrogenase